MLIGVRTPLRVSFFGGGTDYPEYFQNSRGSVLGMAINRYVYVVALRLSSIIDYKYRISYSRNEMVADVNEILHPVVRECLKYYNVNDALDISIQADLPARSGLGSSSSFAVGFISLITRLQNRAITKSDLARQAIHVERVLLGENVGVQDQYHAAFGGINRFDFSKHRTQIAPIQLKSECETALTSSLFLLYTGVTRFASETLNEQMENTRNGSVAKDLSHLLTLTEQGTNVLESDDPEQMLLDLGAMLHEGWETKKQLSSKVSNPLIDELYAAAREAGAIGGKLCGAGGGGFLLLLVPPWKQDKFHERMRAAQIIRIGLDTSGATFFAQ